MSKGLREIIIKCDNCYCLNWEDGECQLRNEININRKGICTSVDYD